MATSLFTPEKTVGKAPGLLQSFKAIILGSWLNVLLIFIPLSWAFNFAMKDSHVLIFVFSFLAIIPLAKLLGMATEELSLRTSQTIAGLLNATLGNAVELIVSIIALTKCEIKIVQSSLIGSVLSNLLLVLGMCFFAGGTKYAEQGFGISATQVNSSLLTIAVIAVLLPGAFNLTIRLNITEKDDDYEKDILALSHGVAILLLLIYASYLVFQLWSHTHLYEDKNNPDIVQSVRYQPKEKKKERRSEEVEVQDPSSSTPTAVSHENGTLTRRAATASGAQNDVEAADAEMRAEMDEEEEPQLSFLATIILLVVVTVLVAVTAEWLVDSIDGLTDTGHISKEFVGVILLPIVGNAAEHVTAVTVAVKDKLTLSMGVAVGSSIQIALFVIPFSVVLGWILDKPLTLLFDPFESIILFLSVLTVNYVVADGKSNWLEGLLLMGLYIILAVIFWYYPGQDTSLVFPTLTCH
jgi:Ca2+:H+ antiporter